MRLRNKKTGQIRYFNFKNVTGVERKKGYEEVVLYDIPETLADLCEEWEDIPKKKYYIIADDTKIYKKTKGQLPILDGSRRQIGNYFSSKEEAEETVEKLKAFHRLKDKGFRFLRHEGDSSYGAREGEVTIYAHVDDFVGDVLTDLDLLFGGEE